MNDFVVGCFLPLGALWIRLERHHSPRWSCWSYFFKYIHVYQSVEVMGKWEQSVNKQYFDFEVMCRNKTDAARKALLEAEVSITTKVYFLNNQLKTI